MIERCPECGSPRPAVREHYAGCSKAKMFAPNKPGRKPGFVGSANKEYDYTCATCRAPIDPPTMVVKRVLFTRKVERMSRSRTVAWLCESCAAQDPDWNRPPYMGAPGNKRDPK